MVSCLKRKQYIKKKRKKFLYIDFYSKFSQYHVAFSRSQPNLYYSSKVVSLKKVLGWALFCFFSLSSEQRSSGGKYHYLSTYNAKTLVRNKIQGKYKIRCIRGENKQYSVLNAKRKKKRKKNYNHPTHLSKFPFMGINANQTSSPK